MNATFSPGKLWVLLPSILGLLILTISPLSFADLTSRGEIRMESRLFTNDGDKGTEDSNVGSAARLEVKQNSSAWTQRLRIFQRVDGRDNTRNVFIVEEAYIGWMNDHWDVKVGSQILNWSATEAFHPADIINSRNFDSNFENAEKIGEPMASVTRLFASGAAHLYYMPSYQKPLLPETTNRLSYTPSGFNLLEPLFYDNHKDLSSDDWGFQWAAKFDYSFDGADMSLHYVDHVDRSQPVILSAGGSDLQPIYLRVKQTGLTYQQAIESWVIKAEIAHRDFPEPTIHLLQTVEQKDHTQWAWGIEYGFSHDSGGDSTFIFEGQTLGGLDKVERAAASIFQRDILVGYRFALNDTYSQEIFASIIHDVERDDETLFNVSYSRRLTDVWSMKSGIRWVEAPQKDTLPAGLEYLHEANQVYLDISRHF